MKKLAVIGAGLLGHGIAQVFAMRGYEVNLLDLNDDLLKKAFQGIEWSLNKFVEKRRIRKEDAEAALSRIKITTSYEEAAKDIDLAIEVVSEKINIKKMV
ncbi:3-hydroxyacyl-CoA dehydrogenase, partial [Candidatus Bathyarchaeota archaeon]|nr:3-hydroxyacyl-CoA dehydrogenase [Candidatus Bathyarchaeota archaeon]